MRPGRRVLACIAVVALLAGSLIAAIPGPAQADTLTPRKCTSLITGDGVRRLDVCARGWMSTDFSTTRAVVEIHTYAWVGSGANQWVDSRSQSITVESVSMECCGTATWPAGGWELYIPMHHWGQSEEFKCRINGPGGSVGCSVPNTSRVAFYSPAITGGPQMAKFVALVFDVSWRDDRGVAHAHRAPVDPDRHVPPLVSPAWFP